MPTLPPSDEPARVAAPPADATEARSADPSAAPPAPGPRSREPVQRWRVVFRRTPTATSDEQKEQVRAWEEALRGSGLPVAVTDGDPPRPRLAFGAPLPVGTFGERELADILLAERVPAWQVRSALAASLPPGHELVEAYDVWLGEAALAGRVAASEVVATIPAPAVGVEALSAAAEAIVAAEALPRQRPKGERTVSYDLRPLVEDVRVEAGGDGEAGSDDVRVVMRLVHDPEKGVGRPEEVLAELGGRVGSPLVPERLVRTRLILREERPAPKGPTGRKGRPPPGRGGG